eukprot:869903-Prorocentrum_minimum.AAC.3
MVYGLWSMVYGLWSMVYGQLHAAGCARRLQEMQSVARRASGSIDMRAALAAMKWCAPVACLQGRGAASHIQMTPPLAACLTP